MVQSSGHFEQWLVGWSKGKFHADSLIFVDIVFILCWLRWPFTVADDFDKCFSTERYVSPGHDMKLPSLIAAIHVDLTGLKHAACR
jgi:hypothetical protein